MEDNLKTQYEDNITEESFKTQTKEKDYKR